MMYPDVKNTNQRGILPLSYQPLSWLLTWAFILWEMQKQDNNILIQMVNAEDFSAIFSTFPNFMLQFLTVSRKHSHLINIDYFVEKVPDVKSKLSIKEKMSPL